MALFNPASRFRRESPTKADVSKSGPLSHCAGTLASGDDSDDWVVLTSESESGCSESESSPRSTRMHTISPSRLRQAAALQLFDDTESDGDLDSTDERSPATSSTLSAPTRARLLLRSSCFGSPQKNSLPHNISPTSDSRDSRLHYRSRLQRSATWHIVTAQGACSATSPRRPRQLRRTSSQNMDAVTRSIDPALLLDGSYVDLPARPGDGIALIRRSLAQDRPSAAASTAAAPRPPAIHTQIQSRPLPARPFASPRQNLGSAKCSGRELMSLLDAPFGATQAAPEDSSPSPTAASTAASTAACSSSGDGNDIPPLASVLHTIVELRTAVEKQSFGRTKTVVLGVDICFKPEHTSDAANALARTASFTWMDRYKKFLWPHSLVTGATLSSIAAKHGLKALLRVGGVVGAGVALMTEDAMGRRRPGAEWRLTASDFAFGSADASLEDQDARHQFARAMYYLCWGMVNGNLRKCSSDNFWLLSAGIKNLELESPDSFSRGLASLGAAAEAEVDKYFPRKFYAALRTVREPQEFRRVTTFALDEISALLSRPMKADRISVLAKVLLGQFDI